MTKQVLIYKLEDHIQYVLYLPSYACNDKL